MKLIINSVVLIVLLIVLLLQIKFNETNINEGMYSNKPQFIQNNKFIGSKNGYVFKKDQKGIGYYIDIKPKIEM
jgi:hypothetical protein